MTPPLDDSQTRRDQMFVRLVALRVIQVTECDMIAEDNERRRLGEAFFWSGDFDVFFLLAKHHPCVARAKIIKRVMALRERNTQ